MSALKNLPSDVAREVQDALFAMREHALPTRMLMLCLEEKGLSLEEKEKEINEIETSDNRVMASNQAFVFEEIQYLPEGNVYYISTKAPLHDLEGNVIGVAGVSIDITKQKNAEKEAIQASAAKSIFVAKVSHGNYLFRLPQC